MGAARATENRMIRTLLLGLVLGCAGPADDPQITDTPDPTDAPATPADEPALIGPEDGSYVAAFRRGGDHFALGLLTVSQNAITGEVVTGERARVQIAGRLKADGSVGDVSVTSNPPVDIVFSRATLRAGVIEGEYVAEGEPGSFAGSRMATLQELPFDPRFDGTYEISFDAQGATVAETLLTVTKGRLQAFIAAESGYTVDVSGRVTEDGTVVVQQSKASDGGITLAEASIDQDSFAIEGIFLADGTAGQITGRRSD
jgi:hypothetical protein